MYKVDLLKGRGIPIRSNPKDIVILSVILLIPVLAVLWMISSYFQAKITLQIKQQQVKNLEKTISEMDMEDSFGRDYELKKAALTGGIAEVATNINQNIQWSPLLEDLVANLPDPLVISSFDIESASRRVTRPRKGDPEKTEEVSVPYKIINLTVSLSGRGGNDQTVAIFAEKLRSSKYFGKKLQDIQISQFTSEMQGKVSIMYRISCIFKPDA